MKNKLSKSWSISLFFHYDKNYLSILMIKIIVYAYQMRKKNYDKKFLSAWLMKVETSRYKMRFFVKGFTDERIEQTTKKCFL